MKRLFALFLMVMLLLAPCYIGIESVHTVYAEQDAENNEKIIDMYLIGGQSNAAGYSTAGNRPYKNFNNVMYAGQTDRLMSDGIASSNFMTYAAFKQSVSFGLGYRADAMGPEYGMASVFDKYYADSDKDAIIFKSATGGTTLCDYAEGASSYYGNWYPRSLWENGYTPSLEIGNTDPTGVMYALFVENFKTVYNELVKEGYTPVVKGMVWMQGESDMWQLYSYSKGYAELLKIFITDIREDLANITSDESLLQMPFIIGKIPTTSISYNNPSAYAINEMQQQVADEMEGVATVETSDLIIVKEDGTYKGADQYHFHLDDMEILGKRFGEALLKLPESSNEKVTVTIDNDDALGEAYTRFSLTQLVGTTMEFYITPADGYEVKSVTFNGVELSPASDGKYEIITVEGENILKVEYKRAELPPDVTEPPVEQNPPVTDVTPDDEKGLFDSIADFFSSIIDAIVAFFEQIFGF